MIGNIGQLSGAIVRTAVISLLGLGVLAGCGSNPTQVQGDSVALVDTGPNAQISNNDLFVAASSNMKALHSFHVEFTEEPKDLRWDQATLMYQAPATTDVSSTITIAADIQEPASGSRFTLIYGDVEGLGPDEEPASIGLVGMLGGNRHATDFLFLQSEVYTSIDGGKGWIHLDPGSAFGLLPVTQNTLLFGDPVFQRGGPGLVEYLTKGLVFADGSPRLEKIDGKLTRHVVATPNKPTPDPAAGAYSGATMWYERVESIGLWISTDAEPAVLRMNAVVRSKTREFMPGQELPDQILYDLNWKWSRLNEDLGTIEAPTGDALVTPSP